MSVHNGKVHGDNTTKGNSGVDTNKLGGQDVRIAKSSRTRRTEPSAFQKLATTYNNWKHGRAVKRSETKLPKAVDKLLTKLQTGTLQPKDTALLSHIRKHADRLNPGHFDQKFGQALQTALEGRPASQRTKFCYSDFGAIKMSIKQVVNQSFQQSIRLAEAMENTGFGGGADARALRKEQGKFMTQIDNMVSAMKSTAYEVRLNDLQSAVDGNITVARDGTIGGVENNFRMPTSQTAVLQLNPNHGNQFTPAAFLESRTQARLNDPKNFKDVGGVMVQKDLTMDWYRMNFQFDDGNIQFSTRGRNDTDVVNDARLFTGNDNAVKVLSSLLNQIDLPVLAGLQVKQDNSESHFLPVKTSYSNTIVDDGHGNVEQFQDPKQIGNVVYQITKDNNGDYQVNMSYEYLTPSISVNGGKIPVNPQNPDHSPSTVNDPTQQQCIKITVAGQFTISGAEANQGRISIDPNAQFTKTYSGKFDMPT